MTPDYDPEAERRKREIAGAIGMAAFAAGFAATRGAVEAKKGEPQPRGIVDQGFDGLRDLGYGFLVICLIVMAIIYWKVTLGVLVIGLGAFVLWGAWLNRQDEKKSKEINRA